VFIDKEELKILYDFLHYCCRYCFLYFAALCISTNSNN